MAEGIITKLEELLTQGQQLAPLGGFEFSGYNARLQNKYLEWRKACLEALEQVGPIGFPYKTKILGDANGGYFFQASAQLIVNQVKELYEKVKASPDLAAQAPTAAAQAAAPAQATSTPSTAGRIIKPPPKKPAAETATAAPPAAVPAAESNVVYVIGEETDPLRQQLAMFLDDVGLKEIPVNRVHGKMIALDDLADHKEAKYAFFICNTDDISYAMFELGHFVGKLGKGRVCVLHMSDVEFPKTIPGVTIKPIVVKLEEASLSIMKELKAQGIKISI
ncbi:MAG: nucleotide-binding protein [Ignavibacteriae bacterium]|nr:nucleotide-binding protein [Ignavibacteriota bacterium]